MEKKRKKDIKKRISTVILFQNQNKQNKKETQKKNVNKQKEMIKVH